MAAKLPIVYIFGAEGISLRSSPTPPETETAELECHCFPNDRISSRYSYGKSRMS